MNHVHVSYQFDEITPLLQESIKKYVQLNLYVNPDVEQPILKPYFNKIFTNKPAAEIEITVSISKNKSDKFDGVFTFIVDGKMVRYERTGSESFRNIDDLVNHAFNHLKREVTGERGVLRKLLKRLNK